MFTTRSGLAGVMRNPDFIIANKVVALVDAATIAVDPTSANVFTYTPAQTATLNAASVVRGQELTFVITTAGVTSFTLTFGTNFKTTSTLATGTVAAKVFTVSFVADGTNYNEVGRTTAM